MVQKIFVLNVITSYLPIFLTAFVYVPFAPVIVPYLDVFQLAVKPFAENEKQMETPKVGFNIDPDRMKKQIIYFTVTAQIVNFGMQFILPYVKQKVFRKVKEVRADRAAKRGGTSSPSADDHREESAFLVRVRNEADLDIYDVTDDFREMIVQFGKYCCLSAFENLLMLARISITLLRHLATSSCLVPNQQLDRATRRRSQNCLGNATACPMESRLNWSVARFSRLPCLAG